MKEDERNYLIQYRFQQAKETVELAGFLIASERFSVAVNRVYYGLYYAVTALAIKHQFNTSKHIQLIGWFNREFILTGIIDKKFGRILRLAYQNRTKSDYDAFISFEEEDVKLMHSEMIEFINEIEKQLKD